MKLKRKMLKVAKFRRALALIAALALLLCSTTVLAADDSFTRILKNVEPKGQTQVLAGETVTLRALAQKEATVVASVN